MAGAAVNEPLPLAIQRQPAIFGLFYDQIMTPGLLIDRLHAVISN
jgi:hypothetical protein